MVIRWQDHIEERKEVMLGKPVFKGTRLTVQHVLEELGSGMSFDDLLDNYPTLKPEHLQAALQYAARGRAGEGWRNFVLATGASITDPSFVRHEQGEYERREELP